MNKIFKTKLFAGSFHTFQEVLRILVIATCYIKHGKDFLDMLYLLDKTVSNMLNVPHFAVLKLTN